MTFYLAALREKAWRGSTGSNTGAKVRTWRLGQPGARDSDGNWRKTETLDAQSRWKGRGRETTEAAHRQKEMEVSKQMQNQKVRVRNLEGCEAGVRRKKKKKKNNSLWSWVFRFCKMARSGRVVVPLLSSLLIMATHDVPGTEIKVKWDEESNGAGEVTQQ